MIGRIQEQIFSQSLAAAALDNTYGYAEDGTINAIYIKSSVNITETITITRVSKNSASYSIVVDSKTMNAESNYIFHPSWKLVIKKGDSIRIQCTNANITGTVFGTVHFEGGINEH